MKSSLTMQRKQPLTAITSLAMAEMTTLVSAVYRRYNTSIAPGFEGKTPAITSRFELFYDETMSQLEVLKSWLALSYASLEADYFPRNMSA